ncbi:MAG TPA: cupin domain-containing protein [Candidatus Obscuribacterales bacterium]
MPVQQQADVKPLQGQNFTVIHMGPLADLHSYKLEVPALNRTVRGKLFIRELLGLNSMQISVNKLPAGAAVPFYHQHRENEECYIFIKGRGQMQIDKQIFDVEEGSMVRISTSGSRTLRSNANEDLYFICVQAKEHSLNADTFEDGIRSEEPVTWPQ